MAKTYGLTERDVQRLQRALRFVEDNATLLRSFRRIRGNPAGGGGGMTIVWATVIRRPLTADAEGDPEEGYDDYVLRLATSSYSAWTAAVYPVDTYRTKDGRLYKSNQETSETWVDEEWDLQPEINPHHFYYGVLDWRFFSPCNVAGSVVPFFKSGSIYYFWQQMTRVRHLPTGDQSILWNEDENRMMGVYG